MSKYTTEVRFICETAAGLSESAGGNSVDEIITTAAPNVFNFDFPIYDENYRLPLEIKILRHYYTREICEETAGLWKLRLQDRLCLIMPYYNQLYKSATLEFNPFYDVDLTRDYIRKNDGSNTTETNSTTNNTTKTDRTITNDGSNTNDRWDLYSDTPQGGINGITADNDSVGNNAYLTNARHVTDGGNENSTTNDKGNTNSSGTDNSKVEGTANNLEEYIEHVRGKNSGASYSKLLEEYRNTLLNIDKMIIDGLSDLFFGLW